MLRVREVTSAFSKIVDGHYYDGTGSNRNQPLSVKQLLEEILWIFLSGSGRYVSGLMLVTHVHGANSTNREASELDFRTSIQERLYQLLGVKPRLVIQENKILIRYS